MKLHIVEEKLDDLDKPLIWTSQQAHSMKWVTSSKKTCHICILVVTIQAAGPHQSVTGIVVYSHDMTAGPRGNNSM